jgi:hypothetical protein
MPLDYDEVPVFRGPKRPSGVAEGVRIPIVQYSWLGVEEKWSKLSAN